VRRRFASGFVRANRTTQATLETREECIGADGPSGALLQPRRREGFRPAPDTMRPVKRPTRSSKGATAPKQKSR
jgi:hypothetical protein